MPKNRRLFHHRSLKRFHHQSISNLVHQNYMTLRDLTFGIGRYFLKEVKERTRYGNGLTIRSSVDSERVVFFMPQEVTVEPKCIQ